VSLFAKLHTDTHLPGFDGATGWLNSEPLTPAGLRGKVVFVDFWTYTCINWLRTLGYVRAWHAKYTDHGLVVVGVHTPEFPFEHDPDNVRWAAPDLRVEYPIALDPDFRVWRAFNNNYWPAVYIADAEGRIRHMHFGEGGYEEQEKAIQMLLREAGGEAVPADVVSVADEGFEAQADWGTLGSPETYLGYEQGQGFASAGAAEFDEPQEFGVPDRLERNQWALSGNWTLGPGKSVLNDAGGKLAFRFHARDVNLVMGPPEDGPAIPFRVLVDGEPPGDAHGLHVDAEGNGTLDRPPRLHQLVRQPGSIEDRTFEISFDAPGVEAYCFTFG
jgi:thiol-disulfide isomerase/thioredoxin